MKNAKKTTKISFMNNFISFIPILLLLIIIASALFQESLNLYLFIFFLILIRCIIKMGVFPYLRELDSSADEALRRKAALKKAEIYLSPYQNIWKNLKLSNNYCYLKLESDGVSITCKEKNYPYRKFNVIESHVHEYKDLWNMFCINFNHNKNYDDLVDDCRLYKLSIYETVKKTKTITEFENRKTLDNTKTAKLDINNSSEIEITNLPGINIIMAKKIVKKRNEIGGFKTIEEIFEVIKLKPHFEKQLYELICIKKMKNVCKKIELNNERNVDL